MEFFNRDFKDVSLDILTGGALLIGSLKLFSMALSITKGIWRNCFRWGKDLLSRYGGEGTWALVTGASDGIGAEFCI